LDDRPVVLTMTVVVDDVYTHTRPVDLLSQRELEVLEVTSRGFTNSQVGAQLNVSVHAVKFHLASVYRKLQVANRTEATAVYLRSAGGETRRLGQV
jgi:DNA-binding NarL/FixJ family response regulator